jgi:hypothetical protein
MFECQLSSVGAPPSAVAVFPMLSWAYMMAGCMSRSPRGRLDARAWPWSLVNPDRIKPVSRRRICVHTCWGGPPFAPGWKSPPRDGEVLRAVVSMLVRLSRRVGGVSRARGCFPFVVAGTGCGWSGWGREGLQAGEGGEDVAGPGPSCGYAQA